MNHSIEVITDFGVYSEEQKDFKDTSSNSLKDTARSKLRCIPDSSRLLTNNLNDKDKDEIGQQLVIDLGAIANNDLDEHKREMVAEARRWIGLLVYKEISGKGYIGKVQDYDEGTELYKIVYEEVTGYDELLPKQEMLGIIAPPHVVREYLDYEEAKEKNKQQKRKALRANASTNNMEHEKLTGHDDELIEQEMMQIVSPSPLVRGQEAKDNDKKEKRRALRARAANMEIPRMKKPYRKRTTKKAKVNDYVPLAFREKKRDAYYWY
ncbi:hypothetical protein SLEP1_g975 [Rubroshorea leprosula]|uniref:Uncharacterized protein n=1 Tax=Rubroshorea leprosula TaxID=152421 RepID=A0AAV5HMS0_9ROSI|nr:hypothetical protein SLEP1_g975 [Rubroshorea leprosula]